MAMSNPNTIESVQAWSALASAVISLCSLAGLVYYAFDNHRILILGIRQAEDIQRPFLALVTGKTTEYAIMNQGNGPALNIHYEGYDELGRLEKKFAKPLAVGDQRAIGTFDKRQLEHHDFVVHYESLSGRRYSTYVSKTTSDIDQWKVNFVDHSKRSGDFS